ncbi:unnamed protein product, partial [Larinioides sclopetarius]
MRFADDNSFTTEPNDFTNDFLNGLTSTAIEDKGGLNDLIDRLTSP